MRENLFALAVGQMILLPGEFGITYMGKCENNFTWAFFAAIIGICITANCIIVSWCKGSK